MRFNKIIFTLSIFVFLFVFSSYADIVGPSDNPEITKGPLLEYQKKTHRPNIVHNDWYKSKEGDW